jgi:hypothetical protein
MNKIIDLKQVRKAKEDLELNYYSILRDEFFKKYAMKLEIEYNVFSDTFTISRVDKQPLTFAQEQFISNFESIYLHNFI